MKTETKSKLIGGVVALAIGAAAIGGGLATDQLRLGSAASIQTLSERNGTLQGQVHTGPLPKGVHPPVPFLGPFAYHKKGVTQCGPAVRLMEGALRRKHLRKDKARNCVGIATQNQIKAFQKSVHYKQTGVYNLVTHLALVKANGYTNEARRDVVYLQRKRVVARKRHNVSIVVAHALLIGSRSPYCQSGSRANFSFWPNLPPCTDCSGFVTWVMWQSGFSEAVGYYGSGSTVGWTGSLSQQGLIVKRNQPLAIGDLVFYPSDRAPGPPWGHVAIYIGHGNVASHGSVGVKLLRYNYRAVGEVRRYLAPPS